LGVEAVLPSGALSELFSCFLCCNAVKRVEAASVEEACIFDMGAFGAVGREWGLDWVACAALVEGVCTFDTGAPQLGQNYLCASICVPHCEQIMILTI